MDRRTSSVPGGPIDLFLEELEIDGRGVVTSVGLADEAAEGEGNVVTGRFITYGVGNLVTLRLENGLIIEGTRQHPIWSVTRGAWVPLADLQSGELLDSSTGPLAVGSIILTTSPTNVYNIEVHGHHVYRIAGDGILVHNARGDSYELGKNLTREKSPRPSSEHSAGHAVPSTGSPAQHKAFPGLSKLQSLLRKNGLMNNAINGFWAKVGHLGTHTKAFAKYLATQFKGKVTKEALEKAVAETVEAIENGTWKL